MHLWADDIDGIAYDLQAELNKGHTLVAYNAELGYARRSDLVFFQDKDAFHDFSQVYNSEHAIYFEWSIQHVLNAVDAIRKNKIDFDKSETFGYADGIYSIYDPMRLENLQSLKDRLQELGFADRSFSALNYYYEYPQEHFNLLDGQRSEGEKTTYYLHFSQDRNNLNYHWTGYEATLQIAPEIPDVRAAGINARELDARMKEVDWSIDHHRESLVEEYVMTVEGNQFLDMLSAILKDVHALYGSGQEGKDAAERLMYKHWYGEGEPWEPNTISLEHLRKLYEFKHEVDLQQKQGQTRFETYELLKSNAVACLAAMPLAKEEQQAYGLLDYTKNQPVEVKQGEELRTLAIYFEQINRKRLEDMLIKIGFEEPVGNDLYWHMKNGSPAFEVTIPKEVEGSKVKFELHFEDAGNDWYIPRHYDATRFHHIEVQHDRINGINTQYVEDAMKKADWYYEYAESNEDWLKGYTEVEKIKDALKAISRDETGRVIATQLWNNHVPFFTVAKPSYISKCEEEKDMYLTLRFSADTNIHEACQELKNTLAIKTAILEHDAKEMTQNLYPPISFERASYEEIKEFLQQEKLAGNHWVAYCENLPVTGKQDLNCFRSNFEVHEYCYENSTDVDSYSFHSIYRIEKELEKELVPQLLILRNRDQENISESKFNDSQLKYGFMTEKEFQFIEKQFMGIGAKEALTPELIEQLKKGVAEIQHPFSKKYDGDGEAKALFYIKKGNEGNLYFLNKWDMESVKEGDTVGAKQTFYNNHLHRNPNSEYYDANKDQTTFTFKSSFSYLMGRPVHNVYKNDNKEERLQWDQAKIKKDEKGNVTLEPRHYRESYPFDLGKVLANYHILDLTKDEYKQRFTQSLERGNLQLATFVDKDGKKEKLYTSPNIPLNALNVYDINRKPVPMDTLLEKGFVQKEFVEKLKETIQRLNQKNGNETSHKQAPVQKNEQQQKQSAAKDEKEGEKASKENKQSQSQSNKQSESNKQSQKPEKPRQRHRQTH